MPPLTAERESAGNDGERRSGPLTGMLFADAKVGRAALTTAVNSLLGQAPEPSQRTPKPASTADPGQSLENGTSRRGWSTVSCISWRSADDSSM